MPQWMHVDKTLFFILSLADHFCLLSEDEKVETISQMEMENVHSIHKSLEVYEHDICINTTSS